VLSFLGGSYVTISGPAAGLAPALFAGMLALGHGNLERGYPVLLVALCITGVVKIVLARLKMARFSALFPSMIIEGMLAAIGLLIIVKQALLLLGHPYKAHEFRGFILEAPEVLPYLKTEFFGLGIASLIAAVDEIDPFHRRSCPHRTPQGMGVSHVCSSVVGGLTIIPGGVKSTAHVLGGGRTQCGQLLQRLLPAGLPARGPARHQRDSQERAGRRVDLPRLQAVQAGRLAARLPHRPRTVGDLRGHRDHHGLDGPADRHLQRHRPEADRGPDLQQPGRAEPVAGQAGARLLPQRDHRARAGGRRVPPLLDPAGAVLQPAARPEGTGERPRWRSRTWSAPPGNCAVSR
jgi:hypothetical protein